MDNKKIVSLFPAVTQIICALGLRHFLVGKSHKCTYLDEVESLPICSQPYYISKSQNVNNNPEFNNPINLDILPYKVNNNLINRLAPKYIFTQKIPTLGLVNTTNIECETDVLIDKNIQIISLTAQTLDDIFINICTIAKIFDVETEGQLLIETLENRLNLVKHKLKYFPDKPSIAYISCLKPMVLQNNWMPQLIQIAGGAPITSQNNLNELIFNWDNILTQNPEILIIMPYEFTIANTLKNMPELLSLPNWQNLNAVKNKRIYIVDGAAYLNNFGLSLIDSVEILAEIINPKYFNFGFEGTGWIKFES